MVGVTTDELANIRGKTPIIPFKDRIEIVRNIRFVDVAIPQEDMDKFKICNKIKAAIMLVGDDWYESEKWKTCRI